MGRIQKRIWNKQSLIHEFLNKRYLLEMGAGKLGRIYGVPSIIIKEVRRLTRLEIKKDIRSKLPKILVFDIETAPLEAYIYQKEVWKAHVSDDKVISQWYVLTWAAKWLFDQNTMSAKLTGKESRNENDNRIVGELWSLFDEADMVIAHNGGAFDIVNMNTRFLVNGFPPTSSYQQIDTLKIARKEFGFTHNGLNALAKVFNVDCKIHTTFELWSKSKNGDEVALKEMERYNIKDVVILEEIYLKLRPWIKSHPNVGLFVQSDDPICPYCGNDEVSKDGNHYYTMTGKYETYVCNKCGAISRARKTVYDKEKGKNLIVSVAR